MKISKSRMILSLVILSLFLGAWLILKHKNQATKVSYSGLLNKSWVFKGEDKEVYILRRPISGDELIDKNALSVTYDLGGLCLYSGPASALELVANNGQEYSIYLAEYGENCTQGEQTVTIPLADFNLDQPVTNIQEIKGQFWYPTSFTLSIDDIKAIGLPESNENANFLTALVKKITRNSFESIPKKDSSVLAVKPKQPIRKLPKPKLTPSLMPTVSTLVSNSPSPTEVVFNPTPSATIVPTLRPSPTITAIPTIVLTPSPSRVPTPMPSSTVLITLTPTPTLMPTKTPAPTPTAVPTPTPSPSKTPTLIPMNTPLAVLPSFSWSIRSVSSMKETKDKICNQDSGTFISSWVNRVMELGINYIAVETPYDNPSCGNSISYTKSWVDLIHSKNINVWHRHMPLAFEGIYNTTKNVSADYIKMISDYIKANPSLFKAGDIFTPIPEPQNGGIQGVTYCPQNICIFKDIAGFNKWLRDAMTASEEAFKSIGLGGKMKIGYYGFDGFVAWGDNNPDWEGILEDATIAQMGNITIDHYPEIVGDTMENDLDELQAKYPNVPIIIGEWGTITGGDIVAQVQQTMSAAHRPNIIGLNYWHAGMGGNEALMNSDFTKKSQFDTVKLLFSR